jgi:hypothetical protein
VDRAHWDGLPAAPETTAVLACERDGDEHVVDGGGLEPVWARIPKADTAVARRDLAVYDGVGRVA